MSGKNLNVEAVLFDFGGVLAEEGFRSGLKAIARAHGIAPEPFYRAAQGAVYETGYVLGKGTEAGFWERLRRDYPLNEDDRALSETILSRFTLRPRLFAAVDSLRQRDVVCGILSDQTDWLETLDRRMQFYARFDRVYNSFRLGKGKRDPTLFDDVLVDLALPPSKVLFLDDTEGHLERAHSHGLRTCRCQSEQQCLECIGDLLPGKRFGKGDPA